MAKEIDQEHIKAIKEMIRGYNKIHGEMNECETRMMKLKKKTEALTKSLTRMRNEEIEFFCTLEEIYGPGKLDPVSGKWITLKEKEEND